MSGKATSCVCASCTFDALRDSLFIGTVAANRGALRSEPSPGANHGGARLLEVAPAAMALQVLLNDGAKENFKS